jgi:hypothetical protein
LGVAALLQVQASTAADDHASPAATVIVGSARSGHFKIKDGTEITFNDWGFGSARLCTTHKDRVNAELLAFIGVIGSSAARRWDMR